MTRDVVYGAKGNKPGYGQFVELFMFDENSHSGINWTNNGQSTVFHFLIKDKDDYENFRDEIITVLKDCEDIDAAYYALEVYLDSDYADDFLEEYDEGEENIMSEFEVREITVEEYLNARNLMVEERSFVWGIYEDCDFKNEKLAKLIEAYDLVIDSLTCLAMEQDKKGAK